jgi:hypothetical protein
LRALLHAGGLGRTSRRRARDALRHRDAGESSRGHALVGARLERGEHDRIHDQARPARIAPLDVGRDRRESRRRHDDDLAARMPGIERDRVQELDAASRQVAPRRVRGSLPVVGEPQHDRGSRCRVSRLRGRGQRCGMRRGKPDRGELLGTDRDAHDPERSVTVGGTFAIERRDRSRDALVEIAPTRELDPRRNRILVEAGREHAASGCALLGIPTIRHLRRDAE